MAHFRCAPAGPPIAWVPPFVLLSLRVILHSAGPHPSLERRGTAGLELHGWERCGGRGGGGGGGVRRKNEPTSTIDDVDVEFKLRSHAQ